VNIEMEAVAMNRVAVFAKVRHIHPLALVLPAAVVCGLCEPYTRGTVLWGLLAVLLLVTVLMLPLVVVTVLMRFSEGPGEPVTDIRAARRARPAQVAVKPAATGSRHTA
jgi:hypothetical protein